MSRRGNCWDNASQESFFGHLKDKTYIKSCETLEELTKEINKYMIYYNNYRYQQNLEKMTPVQYRNHLLNSAQAFLKLSLTKGTFYLIMVVFIMSWKLIIKFYNWYRYLIKL